MCQISRNSHFRSRNEKNVKTGEVTDIYHTSKSISIEGNEMYIETINEEEFIGMGTILIKTVRKMNHTLSELILNIYFNCLLSITGMLYATSSILFNTGSNELYLYSTACFLAAVLYICRLIWITHSGYNLTEAMKACAHKLDRLAFRKTNTCTDEANLLKQDLKYYSESPIAPFSAFSLSYGTLIGTLTTIVTYLIVLIQFKSSETPIGAIQNRNMSWIGSAINSSTLK